MPECKPRPRLNTREYFTNIGNQFKKEFPAWHNQVRASSATAESVSIASWHTPNTRVVHISGRVPMAKNY